MWEYFLRNLFEPFSQNRFVMQRYCGQEKCQVSLAFSVGGFDGSLPQIFSFPKNWDISSALSNLTLALFSLLCELITPWRGYHRGTIITKTARGFIVQFSSGAEIEVYEDELY